ncbi:hypothetical protein GWI33_005065 [Rhynchophorus ferrugineus]|uniref:Uncharacterized protein n=1 Tax=Rhynchophorus ferrugineus TaxID=354439 RepID=A0A834IL56_RHYFE|nr:hypothetical protein GWI33_005065 [Rhynchophorus ferrugineus]
MDSVEWFNNFNKEEDSNSAEKHSRPPDTLHNIEQDLVTTTPPPEQKPKLFINKSVKNDPDEVVSLIDDEEEEEAVESYRNETREALHQLVGLESESEYKFIEAIEKYRDILESQVELFSGKHLKEAVTKDLVFITTNYKKIGIMYIEKYLDIMSEILVFVCDVIRNFFTSQKYLNMKVVKRESRRIKMLLRDCLLNRLDRIMHILLRVRVSTDVMEHQVLWAGIFRYFLARVSTYNNKDNIVRGFIIFQRLKKSRPEKEGPTIESYMYKVLKKTKRELRKIPILDEIFEKMENDPLYSVRDMCVHYNRYYKKKQNDTSYYDEDSRKNVVETEVFDSNWKPRCDLSQIFFSNLANSNSTFSQILAERKPMEGVWGCPKRPDAHDNDIFGGTHMKSEHKLGIKTDIVILDDDSDDDGVVLVSEDIKTITVPSDSDNSKSSFSEDLKSARVGDMVEASAQTEEEQELRIVTPETPVIKDSHTNELDRPSVNQDNITLKENTTEPNENQVQAPVPAQTIENQTLSGSNETQNSDNTQISVSVPSMNENSNTSVDDATKYEKPSDPTILENDQDRESVISRESSDEAKQQSKSVDNVVQKECVVSDKTVEENDVCVQSNQNEDIQKTSSENTATRDSNNDNSSLNKPQDESSVELPIQAECDTTDNNPIDNRLLNIQTPSSNGSMLPSFETINAVKAKAYFDQFDLHCGRLNGISESDDANAARRVIKNRNKSEKQLECDSTVERLSIANSSEESLGCDPDEANADTNKLSTISKATGEPKAPLKEASSDVNREKPSSKLIEFFQSFAVEETDALPLAELGSVASDKDNQTVSLEPEDQQVILYANSPTMLSVSDSLIIDEGSPKESASLSDLSETLLSLDQMKISSGDGESSDTVVTAKDIEPVVEITTISSPRDTQDQTLSKGNDKPEPNGSLKVRLPLVQCAEALDKFPVGNHASKKASKEGKGLKRRRTSTSKNPDQLKSSHKTDAESWHQNKRSLGAYLSLQKNNDDSLPQHTELFNYGMEGPLQKPLANGKNAIDTWSWWNEEESQWNDTAFSDFDTNKSRISVVPDTQLCQSKKTIYPKTSETTTKSSKSGNGSGRVTFQQPKSTVPKRQQQARARSKDPSVEKMNEKVQRSLQPIEILCCLFKEKQMSKSHDNNVIIAEEVYSSLTYHNSNSYNYDALHANQDGLFVGQETPEINPNLLHGEKSAKNEEFGAITRTLNDVNAVLDQDQAVFVGQCGDDTNAISDSTANVLIKDSNLFDDSLVSGLTVPEENAYFNELIQSDNKKMDASGRNFDAQKVQYVQVPQQATSQSYFEPGQGYTVSYYQDSAVAETQAITTSAVKLSNTTQAAAYYPAAATSMSHNSQLPLIQPSNLFYSNPLSGIVPKTQSGLSSSKTSKSSSQSENEARKTPKPSRHPYPGLYPTVLDSKKASSSKSATVSSKARSSPKLEDSSFKSRSNNPSPIFYSAQLEDAISQSSAAATATLKDPKTLKLEEGALKARLNADESSPVFLPNQLGELVQNAPVYMAPATVPNATKLEDSLLKSQLVPNHSATTYYPSPVPTLGEVVQNSASLQSFLASNASKLSKMEEVKAQLPPKKRKLTDEEDMSLYLALSEQKKLEDNISYPAKRQMSIADLQRDLPKIKTLAARKLYPDGTYPDQGYYCPDEYGQYDYNKRSVMNVYINGLRECSANYPLCLMIGTVHTCMNSQNPENGQFNPEQAVGDSAPTYEAPPQPVQPAQNLQKNTPTDMSQQRTAVEQRTKRGRKGADGQPPKRGHKPKEIIRKQNNGQAVGRKRKRVSDNGVDDIAVGPKKKNVYKHVTINNKLMYDNFNGHSQGKAKLLKPNTISSGGGILKATSKNNQASAITQITQQAARLRGVRRAR